MEKKLALSVFLGADLEEIDTCIYDEHCSYEYEGSEYLVLLEEEIYDRVESYVEDTLWAFTSSFLAEQTGLPEIVFSKLSDLCEEANEPIRAIVDVTCSIEEIVSEAIRYDGAGHFLASYDGYENEIEVNNITYYIYRV